MPSAVMLRVMKANMHRCLVHYTDLPCFQRLQIKSATNAATGRLLMGFSCVQARSLSFNRVCESKAPARSITRSFPRISHSLASLTSLRSEWPWHVRFEIKSSRAMSTAQAKSQSPAQLQELPDSKFWNDAFEEIKDNYPGQAITGVKIETWLKKARDPVKKGENIVEVEIAGAIISLRAEANGFLGTHLIQEGSLLAKGEVAVRILSEPEPLPSISESEMDQAMVDAQGSVSELKGKIAEIEVHRAKVLDDFSAAYNLASIQGLSKSPSDFFSARMPGLPTCLILAPLGFLGGEVTKDLLLQFDTETSEITAADKKARKPQEMQADTAASAVHGAILRAHPTVACLLEASAPHATALLSYVAGGQADGALRPWDGGRFLNAVAVDKGAPPGGDAAKEGARLAAALGGRRVLVLPGRGVLVAGGSVAEAYDDLYHLERAAQLALLAGGAAAAAAAPQAATAADGGAAARRIRAVRHFEGLKRLLRNDLPVPRLS